MLGSKGDFSSWLLAATVGVFLYVALVSMLAEIKVLLQDNFEWHQGHQELSGKSDENKSFKSNQLAPSIYIMIELCFFSLDQ